MKKFKASNFRNNAFPYEFHLLFQTFKRLEFLRKLKHVFTYYYFLISSTELKFEVFSCKNDELLNKAFNPYLIPLKVDCPLFHNAEINIYSFLINVSCF